MTASDITEIIKQKLDGIEIKSAYSETTFFYNPKNSLPHGVYFLTIKEKDGPNDKASQLSRAGVFRLSFKPKTFTYSKYFGVKPRRPRKNEVVSIEGDPAKLDSWMPHSIYAWMGWTMILNPSEKSFALLFPYIEESYKQAIEKFSIRTKSRLVL